MAGHIRKRGDKWYFSFEAGTVDGKRKRVERVGGKTKKEAESALRKALEEFENKGSYRSEKDISVADYMNYWYQNYVILNCKHHTQNAYRGVINNHINPELGIYKLKNLTPSILQEFINKKYLQGYTRNYLISILATLTGSIKYAVYPCQFIKENPAAYIKLPKIDSKRSETNKKIISMDDFNKIIERFPSRTPFYIPLMIGYYAGLRIGEVMGLTWDDIDLEKGIIYVNKILYKHNKVWCFGTTKTQSSVREVSIGQTLIDALKEHRVWQNENRTKYNEYYTTQYIINQKDELGMDLKTISSSPKYIPIPNGVQVDLICKKESGEFITPDSFKYPSKVINHDLGILFNFHSLRHTHATILIENGANIKDVQARLGHSRIATTLDTYTHQTDKMKQESVDIFESANKKSLPTS
ncbi:tyrosine-type recombinase/integrase [Turicibacter sanguinis]|nr:tyrosine-type recombinase/integrase [Turicibacter sanguinis]